jgi:hypothetical protein
MSETRRFVIGESRCFVTLRPPADCEHCQELAKAPPGPPRRVLAVDHGTGTVTFGEVLK